MANGIVTRKNIENLTATELAAVRNAYQNMQQISDDRGFNHIAGFHGIPDHYCHNEDPYVTFLPWHRAYLYWFEQYVRDQNSSLGVPYWDWTGNSTHTTGVPHQFADAQDLAGNPNSLYRTKITTTTVNRFSARAPLPPALLDSPDFAVNSGRLSYLLNISDFLDFTEELEDKPHNAVHGWTGGNGGDMGAINTAAFDPIFFSHHAMIDRIWQKWQEIHGIANIPDELKSRTLPPFGLTVADVLDISKLGYNYDA